ncbi:MAG: chemotaxis protein CheW [Planctomycetota bacterium]
MSSNVECIDAPKIIDTDKTQLVTFAVGDIILGVDIGHVQEINRSTDITEVPGAPKQYHGVVNLRGDVVTILNPHHIFNIPEIPRTRTCRNLILNLGEDRVGVLVDRILDILDVRKSEFNRRPSNVDSIDRKYIESVYLQDDQIVIVVSLEALADAHEEAQATA